MKKFISYVLSIIIVLTLMMYVFDFVYTQIYNKSKPRNITQYILKTQKVKSDIVFLGSSRVVNHIDTKLFEDLSNKKTINLGVEGTSLNDNLLQLKLLVNKKNSISKIYLQIDSNYNFETPSIVMTSEAMPFLKNEIIKSHYKKYIEDFNYLNYLPFYRYIIYDPKIGFREAFFSFLNKTPSIDLSIGFLPKFGNDISKQRVLPYSILKNNLVLKEIIGVCNENKIEIIFYVSPYCSKIVNKNYIDKLKNKIPNLIDLTSGYGDDLFFDCGHLNIQGAKLFTKNLYDSTFNKGLN